MNISNPNILFLGDSITAEFDVKKYLPEFKLINKAVSGDSTIDTLRRINESWFEPLSQFIFVCIGTNDLARDRSIKFIIENILKIIELIKNHSPSSRIILTSIFPTRENPPRPNEIIVKINQKLATISVETGYFFFNLHQYFTDSNGSLKAEFTDDGLHLTKSAYEKWASLFKEFYKTVLK